LPSSSRRPPPEPRLHRARKRFGQHFLHEKGVLEKLLDAIQPAATDFIVEIGPGEGALTRYLQSAQALHLIELDRDLAARLAEQFPKATIHAGDALEFDFAQFPAGMRIVGNLPYNISTPLLFHIAAAHAHVSDLHVMLQKEVIDRIVAAPNTGEYGRLTVMLAPWFETRHLFDVGPGAFVPAPRVWSAVARLRVRTEPAFVVPPAFARTVSAAFSARRKTLRNALRSVVDVAEIEALGIDPGRRPETLSPAEFAAVAARAAPDSETR